MWLRECEARNLAPRGIRDGDAIGEVGTYVREKSEKSVLADNVLVRPWRIGQIEGQVFERLQFSELHRRESSLLK